MRKTHEEEKVFLYKDKLYPSYIKRGNACKFIIPTAQQFCKGKGLDIGGTYQWRFPGAQIINTLLNDGFDAFHLPNKKYDYIFSSHTLEHLLDYVEALKYWKEHLKEHGVLFLYLPHYDMEYWHPQNNTKHKHAFLPDMIHSALYEVGFKCVLSSERDLYWSFSVVGIL